MIRQIIHIDEEKCNGCGECIPNCPEGALQIIEGKVRLVSDLFCDGLGACIGHCPEGAITVEEREAEAYDEPKVMANVIEQGEAVILAHLQHLQDHNESGYLQEALAVLNEKNIQVDFEVSEQQAHHHGGCPGARVIEFDPQQAESPEAVHQPSELRQWPVQLHLLPVGAPYLKDADLLLSADCVAYAVGDFHSKYLKGKRLTIACPKLDNSQEIYLDKLTALIDSTGIRSLTVLTMEVPCCGGLLQLARQAADKAHRKVPIHWTMVSIQGEVLQQEAVS